MGIVNNPNVMMASMFGKRKDYANVQNMVVNKSPQELSQLVFSVARDRGIPEQQVMTLANQIGLSLQKG